MKSQVVLAICLILTVGFGVIKAEEYTEERNLSDVPAVNDEAVNDEAANSEMTSAMVMQDKDAISHDARKKGFCHWSINTWYKPGYISRCNCMKCTCTTGGKWDCAFNFAYCPFFFCGNSIYNPSSHICCCGKLHPKKASWGCCGYFYYNTASARCCDYYTVKAKNANCPRSKV